MRILVTGSRDWDDVQTIEQELDHFYPVIDVLVSGHCPTGADAIAEAFWSRLGGKLELYPADWDGLGKKAGFVRNSDMIETMPDLCLAFIRNGSKGATMTVRLAHKRGIEVMEFLA